MAGFIYGVIFTLLFTAYIIAFVKIAHRNELESLELERLTKRGNEMEEKYTKLKAIESIIGKFNSIGETNIDNERYFNLIELEYVLKALITSLIYESQNVIDRRYSVNKSGNKAFEIIDEIYESTKEALIDLRNKL